MLSSDSLVFCVGYEITAVWPEAEWRLSDPEGVAGPRATGPGRPLAL